MKVRLGSILAVFIVFLGLPCLGLIFVGLKQREATFVIMGILIGGIGSFLGRLSVRKWPRELDQEGMVLRNGERLLWKDVSDVERVEVRRNGVPVGCYAKIWFGGTPVNVNPRSLANGAEIIAYISKASGQDLSKYLR